MIDFSIIKGRQQSIITVHTYVGARWLERERGGDRVILNEHVEDLVKHLQEKGFEVEVI